MKKNSPLLLLFLLLVSCEKHSFDIYNLNNDQIQVLGHGGMGIHSLLPMNSVASVENCLDQDVAGTELDVQMTKDGVLVAFHDGDLSESTNSDGMIHNLNWSEVEGAVYSDLLLFSAHEVVSIENLLTEVGCLENKVLSFDCKLYTDVEDMDTYYEDFSNAILYLQEQYQLNLYIESQSPEFLGLMKQKDPMAKLFYYPESFDEALEVVIDLELFGISISTEDINASQVEQAHDNGVWIALWNVNTRARNIEAIEKNPDIIQGDKLNHLLSLLD